MRNHHHNSDFVASMIKTTILTSLLAIGAQGSYYALFTWYIPANQPPNADVSNVTVPISPASALVIAKAAMIAGIAKLKICTSNASSAHPPKQAQNVRFSFEASSRYHAVNSEPEFTFAPARVIIICPPNGIAGTESVSSSRRESAPPVAPWLPWSAFWRLR